MIKHPFTFLFISISIIGFMACDQETKEPLPDVSHIHAATEFVRYDKSLAEMDATNPSRSYDKLVVAHPNMTDLYFKKLTNLYDRDRDTFNLRLKGFIQDKRIENLVKIINKVYPDMKDVEAEVEQATKYFKFYFPKQALPRIYTLFTEFGFQTFIFSDTDGRDGIGISLDMFLGDAFDYKSYNPTDPAFSDYLTRSYNRDHLAKKTMEILIEDVMGNPPGRRFIDQMLHNGKKLYLLQKILPTHHDSIIHEYTREQMEWVKSSELQMWDFFLKKEIMYDTDQLKLSRYLQPSPTSKGMPPASPGRTANYMGYKIIQAFIKRHPDMTMGELINFKDSQKLLEDSRFKPSRK